MAKLLTDRLIRAAKTDKPSREIWDSVVPSFGIRVNAGGRKSFQVFRRVDGKMRRFKLGTYPPLSLADARGKARAILSELAAGRDPRQRVAQDARL